MCQSVAQTHANHHFYWFVIDLAPTNTVWHYAVWCFAAAEIAPTGVQQVFPISFFLVRFRCMLGPFPMLSTTLVLTHIIPWANLAGCRGDYRLVKCARKCKYSMKETPEVHIARAIAWNDKKNDRKAMFGMKIHVSIYGISQKTSSLGRKVSGGRGKYHKTFYLP